jgi:hypothetical protein
MRWPVCPRDRLRGTRLERYAGPRKPPGLVRADRATPLVAPEVAARIASTDAAILSLECLISDRGTRFPDPRKPFFFRAPPVAA